MAATDPSAKQESLNTPLGIHLAQVALFVNRSNIPFPMSESDDKTPPPSESSETPESPENDMPMPGEATDASDDEPLPPPPTFGRQMAQLVIIPALIVIVCVGIAMMFGMLAGQQTDIDTYLAKLRQGSGKGRVAFNLQDPRYKDRGLAAYNIATMIPEILKQEQAEQQRISDELLRIHSDHVAPEEDMLQSYLLLALGQLGQSGGLEPIIEGLDSEHATVRQAAVRAVLDWPDREAAGAAQEMLVQTLNDDDLLVASLSAAALGEFTTESDQATRDALVKVIQMSSNDRQEVIWNAAVALAKLGDQRGEQFVVNVLLNREALAKVVDPAPRPGSASSPDGQYLSPTMQDRVIFSTLASAPKMQSSVVWDKIRQLADNDPNPAVKSAAKQLVHSHDQKSQ